MTNLTGQQPRQRKPKNDGFTPAELKRYLDYIGALGSVQVYGCILCKAEAEVAHVKFGEPCEPCEGTGCVARSNQHYAYIDSCADCQGTGHRYGKIHGLRQHRWSINLCPAEHRLYKGCQHDGSEERFWQERGIDILAVSWNLQQAHDNAKSRADALQAGLAVLEGAKRCQT